jgi:hypothetical protein
MALCVQQSGTTLEVVGAYTVECLGYALMTAQEYADTPSLSALFAMPDPATVQQAFMAGCSLPLILWLVAWGFGTVVGFINRRADPVYLDD